MSKIGNHLTNVPLEGEQLRQIGMLNCVVMGLQLYLSRFHDDIFQRQAAESKDYAVAYYEDEKDIGDFLARFAGDRQNLPAPKIEFHADKAAALIDLAQRHYAAFSWRGSPQLVLMY